MATTLFTATRAPAKASSNPTSDPNPSLSTTSAAPVATKTGLANCDVQGTPSPALTSNILDRAYAAGPISCQLLGIYISKCEELCVLLYLHQWVKVSSCSSEIYFSDKYPDDGSNFCFGSAEL
ncbi:uncharacterized protein K444DRAFT_660179 [Hyaloscypha bicolor E]|uniref:Uncharacterized protein n=1 Tax=Hyaloscypha bicolor E TaxID=1095630 RepID=A0A2J6TPT4_9HELO|nr:uncharacterized protein K444DRAFT_660179 [Hyaloscypha bicolor E]PMD65019.1 hypothetical protein K444DRAFT_660179 [Hyaloscypha bicolor E]